MEYPLIFFIITASQEILISFYFPVVHSILHADLFFQRDFCVPCYKYEPTAYRTFIQANN